MAAGRPPARRLVPRLLAAVLVLLALAACGAGDSGGTVAPDVGDVAADGERAPAGEGEDAVADDREVIVTGSLTVAVDAALEAADEAARLVIAAGGRVDSRTERPGEGPDDASADLTLRIPADRVDAVVEDLQALGQARDLVLDRQDVTLTVRDLDARIAALEVSISRLEELMAGAQTTADLLEAEAALTERQAELDSLQSQRTYLGEQVALATLWLSLVPREGAATPDPGGFWGGVLTGWNALVTAVNRAIEVVGILLPWALLAGLVTGVVLLARRSRPRRQRPPGTGTGGPTGTGTGGPPPPPGSPPPGSPPPAG